MTSPLFFDYFQVVMQSVAMHLLLGNRPYRLLKKGADATKRVPPSEKHPGFGGPRIVVAVLLEVFQQHLES